jgi:hypothetical protein
MFGLSVTDKAMRQQLLEMLLEIIQEAESGGHSRTIVLK